MSGKEAYSRWHWGVNPSIEVQVKPPSVVTDKQDKKKWEDMELIECGRLVEIHYSPLDSSLKRRDKILKLDKKTSNECHLAFDNGHRDQRLYFILSSAGKKLMLKKLKTDYERLSLSELSAIVGGRHGTDDYENIEVSPVGVMTNVVYACEKKGDGYSFYIHSMGEESGIKPMLAISKDGSIWFAGGNYTSPVAGITD